MKGADFFDSRREIVRRIFPVARFGIQQVGRFRTNVRMTFGVVLRPSKHRISFRIHLWRTRSHVHSIPDKIMRCCRFAHDNSSLASHGPGPKSQETRAGMPIAESATRGTSSTTRRSTSLPKRSRRSQKILTITATRRRYMT